MEGDLPVKVKKLGIKIYPGSIISNTSGRKKLKTVQIKKINQKNIEILNCDLLCISGGWSPTVHLFTQSRGKLKFREEDSCFIPHLTFQDTLSIGSCNGVFDLKNILDH